MRIDRVLPDHDATTIQHAVIDADPARVYVVTLEADFVESARSTPSIRALFALRTAPSRIVSRLGRRADPPEPESMSLARMESEGEWVRLDEDFGHEIVFGAIGRFWGREIEWRRIDAGEFAAFSLPGYAKIACNFSLRPYGDGRTVLSYEARTLATDPAARRGFLRYWRVVSPFVGVVMRGQLRFIKREAERPYSDATPPPSASAARASSTVE